MHALVGWEIFWDESAACQEKCAGFKCTERRLKEKEEGKEGKSVWVGLTRISGAVVGTQNWSLGAFWNLSCCRLVDSISYIKLVKGRQQLLLLLIKLSSEFLALLIC